MTDNTIKQRQAALREREREVGMIRRTVKIHERRDAELKEIVAKWMDEDTSSPQQ